MSLPHPKQTKTLGTDTDVLLRKRHSSNRERQSRERSLASLCSFSTWEKHRLRGPRIDALYA